ncbi:MAG: tRNA pseudouridine(55) synthase TruB [Bacteroidetes bacterium]|jgi:tRNA pseudouridine55 synthase|nr:tRNA pseudouridine(55) synthase TruB [Bacteroidota bacterium]
MPVWDFNVSGEILLVDKPDRWSSFDVVRKVRNIFRVRKIGHAGTLDPRATGLLVICTGPKTKLITEFVGYDKEYTGGFRLGITTASHDLETPVELERSWAAVTELALREACAGFIGTSRQTPPMYSAAKVRGKALYKYARAGKTVERPDREISIPEFEATRVDMPNVQFRLVCSKGTYVRSVVHDLGERLQCGATLTALRRERVGPWSVADAWTIERLIEAAAAMQMQDGHAVRTTA